MKRVVLAAVVSTAVACLGCTEAPLVYDYTTDPGPTLNQPGPLDTPPPPVPPVVEGGEQPFTGVVKDYVTAAPVDGASISSYGLAQALDGTAVAGGNFSVDVPVQSVFWAEVSGPGLATTYDQVTTANGPTQKDLYALSTTALTAFATEFGKTQDPGCGVVVVYLTPGNGGAAGIGEIALGSVNAEGPYFLDANKAADADLDETSASGRAVFFNVCPTGGGALTEGAASIVTLTDDDYSASPFPLRVFPGGVTLAKITVAPIGDGPGPDPVEPVPTLSFETDILPIFNVNGCAACHAPGGTAEATGLYFDDEPENIWNQLRTGTARVNLANPPLSYVLVRPLVEEPADHPNGSFDSTENADYKKILQWIEEGAPWTPTNLTVPPVDVAVNFATDVYPIFQERGCTACHDATDPAGGVNFTGGATAVLQVIANEGLLDINYPDRSKLLRNPYCGPTYCQNDQYPETHETRVFTATTDPDYQTMLQWIAQGAQEVPPPVVAPPLKTNVDFGSEVLVRLHARGCMGCHDATDPAGGLDMTGTPAQVLPRLLLAGENRVVPQDIQNSQLISRPLATRADVNHTGGKTVPNESDDFYLYVAGWITDGALAAPNNPALAPIDFDTQVYPLFAANGCTGCHGAAGGSGGLELGGGAAAAKVEAQGVVIANDGLPSTSKLLTNPLALYPNEPHGGNKLIQATNLDFYKYVQRWINEGAQ